MLITQLTVNDRNRLPETIKNIETINVDAFLQAAESWLNANPATNYHPIVEEVLKSFASGETSTPASALFSVEELAKLDANSEFAGTCQIVSVKPTKRNTVGGDKRWRVKAKITAANTVNGVTPLNRVASFDLNETAKAAMETGTFVPEKGVTFNHKIVLVVTDTAKNPWTQIASI